MTGEEAQVDYGTGPMVRDPQSGRYRRTRMFVLTLGYSRKAVRLLGFQSSSRIWAELHEQAFNRLVGSPRTVVLDNLTEGVLNPIGRACVLRVSKMHKPTPKPTSTAGNRSGPTHEPRGCVEVDAAYYKRARLDWPRCQGPVCNCWPAATRLGRYIGTLSHLMYREENVVSIRRWLERRPNSRCVR